MTINSFSLRGFFSDHTVAHAIDNQRITEEVQLNRDLTFFQKCKKGFEVGVKGAIQGLFISMSIYQLTKLFFDTTDNTRGYSTGEGAVSDFKINCIMFPVVEEIVFRGIIQNGASCFQKIGNYIAPSALKNTRAFQWLTSPASRILGSNALFALAHLSNSGTAMSLAGAAAQTLKISLHPSFSILHETTGDIIAPIAAHIVNNSMAMFLT